MNTMRKPNYRAVVVGCGARAHDHVRAYSLIDRAAVVACCAPSVTRRDAFARQYGLQAYADAEAMIRETSPDIVHIVTWPDVRVAPMTLVAGWAYRCAPWRNPSPWACATGGNCATWNVAVARSSPSAIRPAGIRTWRGSSRRPLTASLGQPWDCTSHAE